MPNALGELDSRLRGNDTSILNTRSGYDRPPRTLDNALDAAYQGDEVEQSAIRNPKSEISDHDCISPLAELFLRNVLRLRSLKHRGTKGTENSQLCDLSVFPNLLDSALRALELADETANDSHFVYPVRDYVRAHWLLGAAYRVGGQPDGTCTRPWSGAAASARWTPKPTF